MHVRAVEERFPSNKADHQLLQLIVAPGRLVRYIGRTSEPTTGK